MKKHNGNAISTVLGLIVLIVIGLFVIREFAPGLWTKVQNVYRDTAGWTEEARRADPVGYLNYAKVDMQQNLDRITIIIRDLETRALRLRQEATRLHGDHGRYQELLNRARIVFQEAESGARGYPVEFAGARYGREDFVRQVGIILSESQLAEQRIEDMKSADENISRAIRDMYEQRAKLRGALDDIDATIVIAQANVASQEVQNTLDRVSTVATDINAYLGAYSSGAIPIRSVDELLKREGEGTVNADVEAFLLN